ncbi:hypothetical protein METBIDRAFT_30704, partial [Metschnikowia bicuspidata var. bicuspidata NRRL YB-4993]
MFRSHSDRRLLPSLASTPSLGNYMALSSRDELVTAPCVPGPIRSLSSARARLQNPLVHSHLVPSFSQVPHPDEISNALGLQTARVLVYQPPEPHSRFDELADTLRALTLEDLGASGESMGTPMSAMLPHNNGLNVLLSHPSRDDCSGMVLALDAD